MARFLSWSVMCENSQTRLGPCADKAGNVLARGGTSASDQGTKQSQQGRRISVLPRRMEKKNEQIVLIASGSTTNCHKAAPMLCRAWQIIMLPNYSLRQKCFI